MQRPLGYRLLVWMQRPLGYRLLVWMQRPLGYGHIALMACDLVHHEPERPVDRGPAISLGVLAYPLLDRCGEVERSCAQLGLHDDGGENTDLPHRVMLSHHIRAIRVCRKRSESADGAHVCRMIISYDHIV